jgi:hypothetical protein
MEIYNTLGINFKRKTLLGSVLFGHIRYLLKGNEDAWEVFIDMMYRHTSERKY